MKQTLFFSFSFLFLFFSLYFTTTLAALTPAAAPKATVKPAPAAPAVAPAKPLVPALPRSPSASGVDSSADDIIKILRKAKSFSVLIRLLKTTQIINQVNAELITTKSGGLTILAPDDGAFSELKAGYLNSLTDGQKIKLVQFHVLPIYVSSSNFDSLSNPVRTLAGDSPSGYQLDVSAYGNSVNITSGVVNATITGVVYTDNKLAIYHVDKVLIPSDFLHPKPAAPAPALARARAPKAEKENAPAADDQDVTTKDISSAISLITIQGTTLVSLGVTLVFAATAMI